MSQSFDVCVFLIFIAVQWRITILWLRAAERRPVPWATAIKWGVLLLNTVLAFGWALDFIPGEGGQRGPMALLMGTCTTAYSFTAIAVLAPFTALHLLRKWTRAEFNPGRRRGINAAGNLVLAAPFAALAYGSLIERLNSTCARSMCRFRGCPTIWTGCACCNSATFI